MQIRILREISTAPAAETESPVPRVKKRPIPQKLPSRKRHLRQNEQKSLLNPRKRATNSLSPTRITAAIITTAVIASPTVRVIPAVIKNNKKCSLK